LLKGGLSAVFSILRGTPMNNEIDRDERIKKIAALNDTFRTTLAGGRILVTSGVSALPHCIYAAALVAIQNFSTFTLENDPYGEHDFGFFQLKNYEFFWKIDYYDQTLSRHTEDATDPTKTVRVLTVMLTEEY
jgi:hypothetical protein